MNYLNSLNETVCNLKLIRGKGNRIQKKEGVAPTKKTFSQNTFKIEDMTP